VTLVLLGKPTADPASLPRWRIAGPAGQPVDVINVGLACCAPEVVSALSAEPVGPAGEAVLTVLVLAGTVTVGQVEGLVALRASLPGCRVLSYGACADSGGPYWDSPVVAQGSGVAVDAFVPGCPPTPQQLIDAVRGLCP
jgi:NADH-quinone oxidoreductase subunit B